MAWVLPGVVVFLNLALPFSNSHGVMGFSCFIEKDCWMDLKLSEVDL